MKEQIKAPPVTGIPATVSDLSGPGGHEEPIGFFTVAEPFDISI
jgi:hypothetical protein